ncbi:MAG: M42 family peptidase [Clostridia bacterium]|nr:M42 family peptidase [Clostridia bacterium]
MMLENLEKLCDLDAVSGREEAVRDYILEQIIDLSDEVNIGATGSVTAFKRGKNRAKHTVMLTANMDEAGLVATRITDDGLIKFDTVGKTDSRALCGKAVRIGAAQIPGVIGIVPVHLTKKEDAGKIPKQEAMTIDIGAASKAEAMRVVRPGDFCAFETKFERLGADHIKGKAIDSRAGCAVLMKLMNEELEYDTFFSFAVLGKMGDAGARCEAFSIQPDIAISIGAARAADIPGTDKDSTACELGKGASVGFMEGRTVYDAALYEAAVSIGEVNGAGVQIRASAKGGSNAGAIQASRGGVRTIAIDVPVRYIDSPVQAASLSDIESVLTLCRMLSARAASGSI